MFYQRTLSSVLISSIRLPLVMSPIWKVSLRLFKSPPPARVRARAHTEVCWLRAQAFNCSVVIFLPLTQTPECPEFPEECYAPVVGCTLKRCNVSWNMEGQRRNQVNQVAKASWPWGRVCAKAWRRGIGGRWSTLGVGTEEVGWTRWRQACILC